MKLTKLIVIFGPTASGKTDLAISLAKELGSEIISADAFQVYDRMSICTSKPRLEQLQEVQHHLIGHVPISENYNVVLFLRDAKEKIFKIANKNKVPIIVGGTGLYIDALLKNFQFNEFSCEDFQYNDDCDENLYEILQKLDPISAKNIHKNDIKRIKHSINFFKKFGYSICTQKFNTNSSKEEFQPLKFGINFRDRKILYERINIRVDHMLRDGLLNEVKNLLDADVSRTASAAIGYKELVPYFRGEANLEFSVERIKQQTRRYSKRQITWFKRCDNVNWLWMDERVNIKNIVLKIRLMGFDSQN